MDMIREVPHGLPVSELTKEFNKVVRLLRSWQPVSSPTVRVETLSNGTRWHAKPAAPRKGGGTAAVELDLNQFKVRTEPDFDPAQEPDGHDWWIYMNGGTAQAIFGTATFVASDDWAYTIGPGNHGFVSLVYRIMQNGSFVHAFDAAADFRVGSTPPQSTAETAYFTIAVVEPDGAVLQGHLGAVYLTRPLNLVESPDEASEPEEEEEE